MKTSLRFLAVLLSGIIILGCSEKQDSNSSVRENRVTVKGELITSTDMELTRVFTGTLEGERQALIYSKIAEAVEEIVHGEGKDVKANDIIAKLDRSGPTSNYIQSQSVYQNAEKNYNKMKYLYEQGAVSESEFDAAETEYKVAQANFDAAARLVNLKSPISGTVTALNVSEGDYLYQGQPVATVAAIDKLRMKIGASVEEVMNFDVGDKVKIYIGVTKQQYAEGKVITVSESADPVTRTFQVEVEINNKEHMFKPGMFAKAEITTMSFDDIIAVSRQAVVDRGNRHLIFLVKGDSVVSREVELGVGFDGMVQIEEGLMIGDTVVTAGQDYLDDGFKINMTRFVNAEGKEIVL